MTQMERIEKTTEVFKKAHTDKISTIFNKVQSIMDEFFNEHLSVVSPLENPFFIRTLEIRLDFYKKELKTHPDLMLIYNLSNSSDSTEKTIAAKMPNMFLRKDGENDD